MNRAQTKRMAFTQFDGGETTRGKWFWKKRWYSICSAHQTHDKDCPRCQIGHWHNVRMLAISSWFHDHVYWLWYFWANNI